jgi:cyclohexa-1,5-dienecarbonyl-CoA hydratase
MTVTHSIADGVGRIVLDRPPLNILRREELTAFRKILAALATEPALRVVILSARGKHFSAGADVGEHLPPHHLTLIPDFLETIAQLAEFPLPVIAAVRGKCLGGGFELIQPADIVVAADDAWFGQPEIVLGLFPPAAVVLLPRRLPAGLAARLIYTGDPVSAVDAERCGFVARLASADEVDAVAEEYARRIARHSAAALRAAKRAMLDGPANDPQHDALRRAGQAYLHDVMDTHDAVEGLRAFVEKRAPVWTHV